MARFMRGRPSTISAISAGLYFMYWLEYRLKAKVVVEQTMGRAYFPAMSLPQKQAESDTTRSGAKVFTSAASISSIRAVVSKDCTLISVVETRRRRFSAFSSTGGRYASQGMNAAPAPSIFSRKSAKQ